MNSIKSNSYFVHFQENGYSSLQEHIKKKDYSSIFILVDENSMAYCYPYFIQNLQTNKRIEVIEIEAGEIHKNLETCSGIWSALTELNADRNSVLITLGGGVITDMGGFVASTFKRGIDFVNIPTTLLSMVDASVGGKTGIDLGVLKNQIGLFANPEMVLIDSTYLDTLPKDEFISGVAEIIKYGTTFNANLLDEVKHVNDLNINEIIHQSIEIKNDVVLQDPKEKNIRKVLNFGHTIGHAIESYFLENDTKKTLKHGEAIAVGMVCETYISSKLLSFPTKKLEEFKQLISAIYNKVTILESDFSPILSLLKHDKKNTNGNVNFVLLNDFEDYQLDCHVSNDLIIESLAFYSA